MVVLKITFSRTGAQEWQYLQKTWINSAYYKTMFLGQYYGNQRGNDAKIEVYRKEIQ